MMLNTKQVERWLADSRFIESIDEKKGLKVRWANGEVDEYPFRRFFELMDRPDDVSRARIDSFMRFGLSRTDAACRLLYEIDHNRGSTRYGSKSKQAQH